MLCKDETVGVAFLGVLLVRGHVPRISLGRHCVLRSSL